MFCSCLQHVPHHKRMLLCQSRSVTSTMPSRSSAVRLLLLLLRLPSCCCRC
jgi:hypothetical protein